MAGLLCTYCVRARPLNNGIPCLSSERIHHFNDERNEDRTGRLWDGEVLEGWIEVQESASLAGANLDGEDSY